MNNLISPSPASRYYLRPGPVGVCSFVLPWHFPFRAIASRLACALVAGNTCVVECPANDSLSALRLAEILASLDVPPGILNILTGTDGPANSGPLSRSSAGFISLAGRRNIPHASNCEHPLPLIVLGDADLDRSIEKAMLTAFAVSGGTQYTILDMVDADWDMVLDVNLKGQFHCAKAVMPAMMNQKWGRIVNLSSSLGLTAGFGTAPYCASKAGIINFTKMLARQMGPYHVCVNCVAPGMVRTPMQQYSPPEAFEMVARMVPLGKVCEASDIAHVILFFCSEPLLVTGQTLVVDGGGTMH